MNHVCLPVISLEINFIIVIAAIVVIALYNPLQFVLIIFEMMLFIHLVLHVVTMN